MSEMRTLFWINIFYTNACNFLSKKNITNNMGLLVIYTYIIKPRTYYDISLKNL